MKQEELNFADCHYKIRAINDTMDLLSGRWKLSIIACLCYKEMRYSELLKTIEGISGKMLSSELKLLEINELISREVLATSPVTVNYRITQYGKSLQHLTDTMSDWGLEHRNRVIKSLKKESN